MTDLTIDNRDVPKVDLDKYLKEGAPLLHMVVTPRFTFEELHEYAKIIRDRLNVEEVVEELTKK